MSSRPAIRAAHRELWPRWVAQQLESLFEADDRPLRAVVIGPRGSGRSTLLRTTDRRLASRDADALGMPGAPTRASAEVLLVDDAHLLPAAELDQLITRAEDPAAGLIVAVASGPRTPAIDRLVDLLERSSPPLVLGALTASDLRDALDPACDPLCVDAIVERTGGIAWLVHAALQLHDAGGCGRPDAREDLDAALLDAVAHRLSRLAPDLRAYVESAAVSSRHTPRDDLDAAAHAEGLLTRSGRACPLVQAAVISAMPPDRFAAAWGGAATVTDAPTTAAALQAAGDTRAAQVLLRHAEEVLHTDPVRAARMFRSVAAAGSDGARVGEARALHLLGDLDGAQSLLDAAPAADPSLAAPRADTAAAIWAERGLAEEARAVYVAAGATGRVSELNAVLGGLAAGDRTALETDPAPDAGAPTSTDVAVRALVSGLRESFGPEPAAALPDLVRASEVFTSVGGRTPTVELPAVVAALAAIGVGDLDLADDVLAEAVRGDQGGRAGRARLRLWSAWVALQRERPYDAEAHRTAALDASRPLGPRDRLLAHALRLSTVRRYDDASALEFEWRKTHALLVRTRFDLFSLLPLTEFAVTAARVKDGASLDRHVADAVTLLHRLGDPVGWSAHLHWAGVQRGILGNAPAQLAPHARALVTASAQNPLAARMAIAGKIWTAVLAGSVDADAVEHAALGLGTVGLAWDGARLAGHGAARSEDRKAISQLLACARRLHPAEGSSAAPEPGSTPAARGHVGGGLSIRELEVADLVLQGKTYAEIGQAIFISPRTAEHHIARIRRRLGATSRSDLIAKLRHLMAELHAAEQHDTGDPSPYPLADAAKRGD
ncbi:LuxR C-terminal-related transcriptional regulator [Microbacterium sp. 179-I 3D4 NHS]|uniref:LuxR C-terminal-related transcriptional regulator n=1 Tax=Microbacterium sp. 179-I 3D4 NHS TaxID=3142381 RepID=UPI0039A34965